MLEIYFLLRHIPFWATPFMIIGGEFAYLYWLKKRKSQAIFFMILFTAGMLANVYYILVGGPEQSVKHFRNFITLVF